ncbi:hypothetical protein CAPTEDRAFT_203679 [Capitella teleta]|uniref:Uncharacterized protein n=1 Tax=Capitella teleta TaxID=283909 RepID=R7TWY5_CAPTE|nr:hypothetical protein CAPTEDRAFT_203679 [Capitella teleta]|eukprot:ELT98418.1 hypothetical protein CAPTEDRAFT_203679 [Capitella teleta]
MRRHNLSSYVLLTYCTASEVEKGIRTQADPGDDWSLLSIREFQRTRTSDLKRAGRLAIRHSNSHRSNRNKNMERGGVLHLSTLKIMTLTGLDLCPESSRWTCRCPQHIQPRKEKDLEEDASFHRPAPVMSEDED